MTRVDVITARVLKFRTGTSPEPSFVDDVEYLLLKVRDLEWQNARLEHRARLITRGRAAS